MGSKPNHSGQSWHGLEWPKWPLRWMDQPLITQYSDKLQYLKAYSPVGIWLVWRYHSGFAYFFSRCHFCHRKTWASEDPAWHLTETRQWKDGYFKKQIHQDINVIQNTVYSTVSRSKYQQTPYKIKKEKNKCYKLPKNRDNFHLHKTSP